MPVCFNLTLRGETEPSLLTKVDEHICETFNVPCDPVKWYNAWYDYIGFRLALGWNWAKIETEVDEDIARQTTDEYRAFYQRMKEILNFLQSNYSANGWREVGKRA